MRKIGYIKILQDILRKKLDKDVFSSTILMIVGGDIDASYYEYLVQYTANLDLSKNVEFIVNPSITEKNAILDRSNVVIF